MQIEGMKTELLNKYAEREPRTFYQLDVHDVGVGGGDYIMVPDESGLCFISQDTVELMCGPSKGVRILVNPEMPKARLKQALTRMLENFDRIFHYTVEEIETTKSLAVS